MIKQIKLDDLLWGFKALSLYPSAMWDENSTSPRIGTCYVYTKFTKYEVVNIFNYQTFNQGSAILKIKFYNPSNLIVQHLLVREKAKKYKLIG